MHCMKRMEPLQKRTPIEQPLHNRLIPIARRQSKGGSNIQKARVQDVGENVLSDNL